jgi:hypothetical protein
MLGWLENHTAANVSFWKDIVSSHFKAKGAQIIQTMSRWETEEKQDQNRSNRHRTSSYDPLANVTGMIGGLNFNSCPLSEMKQRLAAALQKMGANV